MRSVYKNFSLRREQQKRFSNSLRLKENKGLREKKKKKLREPNKKKKMVTPVDLQTYLEQLTRPLNRKMKRKLLLNRHQLQRKL